MSYNIVKNGQLQETATLVGISADTDNTLTTGTDGGLFVGKTSNVTANPSDTATDQLSKIKIDTTTYDVGSTKYYETEAEMQADLSNIPNKTTVLVKGDADTATDPYLHRSDIATLAQIAGGTTTDGKVASAEDVYELNNSITWKRAGAGSGGQSVTIPEEFSEVNIVISVGQSVRGQLLLTRFAYGEYNEYYVGYNGCVAQILRNSYTLNIASITIGGTNYLSSSILDIYYR